MDDLQTIRFWRSLARWLTRIKPLAQAFLGTHFERFKYLAVLCVLYSSSAAVWMHHLYGISRIAGQEPGEHLLLCVGDPNQKPCHCFSLEKSCIALTKQIQCCFLNLSSHWHCLAPTVSASKPPPVQSPPPPITSPLTPGEAWKNFMKDQTVSNSLGWFSGFTLTPAEFLISWLQAALQTLDDTAQLSADDVRYKYTGTTRVVIPHQHIKGDFPWPELSDRNAIAACYAADLWIQYITSPWQRWRLLSVHFYLLQLCVTGVAGAAQCLCMAGVCRLSRLNLKLKDCPYW